MGRYIPAAQFAKALEAAGVISDLDTITRVVIDVNPAEGGVYVYVQRVAGKPIAEVAGLLGEMMRDGRAVKPGTPRSARYWTAFPLDLLGAIGTDRALADAGLRISECGQRRDAHSKMLLIEDDDPPPGLDDDSRQVELIFERAAGGIRIAGKRVACCDMHGRQCEPPSELCCENCTEARHPAHPAGEACASPDLSGAVAP